MAEVEKKRVEDEQEMSLEEGFEKLDALAEKLEDRELALEESFALYKEGMELLKRCSEKIDAVEKKMLQVNADGEMMPFE